MYVLFWNRVAKYYAMKIRKHLITHQEILVILRKFRIIFEVIWLYTILIYILLLLVWIYVKAV